MASLLFWRGIFGGLTICVMIVARHRRGSFAAVRAIGRPGLAIAAMSALAAWLYLSAFRHTTVADVAIIYTTLPFVTAGLAWLLLGEREGWRFIAASLLVLLGAAIMLGGALGTGHLTGDLLAFGMTAVFGLMMVVVRRNRAVSMLPAMALSCFLMSAFTWPSAKTGPLGELPLANLALFGSLQLGLGLILLTLGMQRVTATRAALIGLLDTPLAPLWVWLAFDEVPPGATIAGGSIIVAAVVWHMLAAPKPAPRLQPEPSCPM